MAEKPSQDVREEITEAPMSYPVAGSADDVLKAAVDADEKTVETYPVPEWGISLKLKPTSMTKWHEVTHQASLDQRGIGAKANVKEDLAWICACCVQPTFTMDQLRKLADTNGKPILRLSAYCQILSGNVNDSWLEAVKGLGESLGAETLLSSAPMTPASDDSEPPSQDPA